MCCDESSDGREPEELRRLSDDERQALIQRARETDPHDVADAMIRKASLWRRPGGE